jgi:hypothetical protein
MLSAGINLDEVGPVSKLQNYGDSALNYIARLRQNIRIKCTDGNRVSCCVQNI